MDKIIEELVRASQNEGTETGECWGRLCDMWRYGDYVSDEFEIALEKEIRHQHKFMKENWTWVEHKSSTCKECGHYSYADRELVWNEEL